LFWDLHQKINTTGKEHNIAQMTISWNQMVSEKHSKMAPDRIKYTWKAAKHIRDYYETLGWKAHCSASEAMRDAQQTLDRDMPTMGNIAPAEGGPAAAGPIGTQPGTNAGDCAAQGPNQVAGFGVQRSRNAPTEVHPSGTTGPSGGLPTMPQEVASKLDRHLRYGGYQVIHASTVPKGQQKGGRGGTKTCKACSYDLDHLGVWLVKAGGRHYQHCQWCKQCFEGRDKALMLRLDCPGHPPTPN